MSENQNPLNLDGRTVQPNSEQNLHNSIRPTAEHSISDDFHGSIDSLINEILSGSSITSHSENATTDTSISSVPGTTAADISPPVSETLSASAGGSFSDLSMSIDDLLSQIDAVTVSNDQYEGVGTAPVDTGSVSHPPVAKQQPDIAQTPQVVHESPAAAPVYVSETNYSRTATDELIKSILGSAAITPDNGAFAQKETSTPQTAGELLRADNQRLFVGNAVSPAAPSGARANSFEANARFNPTGALNAPPEKTSEPSAETVAFSDTVYRSPVDHTPPAGTAYSNAFSAPAAFDAHETSEQSSAGKTAEFSPFPFIDTAPAKQDAKPGPHNTSSFAPVEAFSFNDSPAANTGAASVPFKEPAFDATIENSRFSSTSVNKTAEFSPFPSADTASAAHAATSNIHNTSSFEQALADSFGGTPASNPALGESAASPLFSDLFEKISAVKSAPPSPNTNVVASEARPVYDDVKRAFDSAFSTQQAPAAPQKSVKQPSASPSKPQDGLPAFGASLFDNSFDAGFSFEKTLDTQADSAPFGDVDAAPALTFNESSDAGFDAHKILFGDAADSSDADDIVFSNSSDDIVFTDDTPTLQNGYVPEQGVSSSGAPLNAPAFPNASFNFGSTSSAELEQSVFPADNSFFADEKGFFSEPGAGSPSLTEKNMPGSAPPATSDATAALLDDFLAAASDQREFGAVNSSLAYNTDLYKVADELRNAVLVKDFSKIYTDNNLMREGGHTALRVNGVTSSYFVTENGGNVYPMCEDLRLELKSGSCCALVSDIKLTIYAVAREIAERCEKNTDDSVVVGESAEQQRELLYIGSDSSLPLDFTCLEFMLYSQSADSDGGDDADNRKSRIGIMLSQLGLSDVESTQLRDISYNKRMLILAAAAAINPNIGCVVINDPHLNIGPQDDMLARRVFALLNNRGKATILACCSEHLMSIAANRVAVIKKGKLAFFGTYKSFIDTNCLNILSFDSDRPAEHAEYVEKEFPAIAATIRDGYVHLSVKPGEGNVDFEQLLNDLTAQGVDYNSIVLEEKSFGVALKEVFAR